MGALALFLVLTGGTAWAVDGPLAGQNTVGSLDIINGEVTGDDLATNAVGSAKVNDRSIKNADLSIGASSSNTIADGGIQGVDVKNDTLTGAQIAEGTLFNDNSLTGGDIDESALDATPLRTRVAEGGCEGNSPDDVMVKVGSVCVDRYENSIWDAPTGGNQITGAIPCAQNGQDCTDIYARSVGGVTPRTEITWSQAQQALANSGKRLPTSAEWQMAVAGTPDGAPCNVSSAGIQNTGQNAGCVSTWGANDMVGNVWELVADWVPFSTACPGWGTFSDDRMCLSGASTTMTGPGVLFRGGHFNAGTDAGPFAVDVLTPQGFGTAIGFRGAR
jgi:hypothetical protein